MKFDIRLTDSLGRLLGVLDAENYHEAAQKAAAQYFSATFATRETGWGGRSGNWVARSSNDDPPTKSFWVGLTESEAAKRGKLDG